MSIKQDLKYLTSKFIAGNASPEEKSILNNWFDTLLSDENHEELVLTDKPEDAQTVKARLYRKIMQKVGTEASRKTKTITLWPRIAAAAIVFVIIGVSFYFFNGNGGATQQTRLKDGAVITAGNNRAILTLADGSQIKLSDSKSGLMMVEDHLHYTDGSPLDNKDRNIVTSGILKVATPKGGQYHIILPDGTKVWLNAASELELAQSFNGLGTRKVELNGEAYFEVAKLKESKTGQVLPFIVSSGKQEVKVLGTHFNVDAYKESGNMKTTLFEGSVRVSINKLGKNYKTILLHPGQSASVSHEQIDIKAADPEEVLAWKNGFFKFNKESIHSVMQKLSRWYNVEVIYDGDTDKGSVSGTINRNKNIKQVLEMLEETKIVKFQVEGRRITVR